MNRLHAVLLCGFTLVLAQCGGGGGGTPPTPRVLSVTVTPTDPKIGVNSTLQFLANVTVEGSAGTSVFWKLSPAGSSSGTIDPSTGLYTAPPSVPTPATVTVTATSLFDATTSGSTAATITVNVALSPVNAQILVGTSQDFTALVQGSPNPVIDHWTVNGVTGGNTTVGTILATGSATASYSAPCAQPPNNGNITVGAVPVADLTVSGSAAAFVNTPAQQIVVSPANPLVATNGTVTFTASSSALPAICGSGPPPGAASANWSLTGGGSLATGCTATTSCVFTAPGTVSFNNASTIKASLPTDPNRFGSSTATIDGPITVTAVRPRSRVTGLSDDITVIVKGSNIDSTANLFPPQTPPCSGPPLANSVALSGNPPSVTGTLPASSQSTAGTLALCVRNSSNSERATAPFVLVDPLAPGSTGTPTSVAVASTTPVPGINVVAIDDAAVGAATEQRLNQEALGVAAVSQTTCPVNTLFGGPVTIVRPATGTAQFILCAGGPSLTGLDQVTAAQYTVSLTGPNPPDIVVINPPSARTVGSGGLQVTVTVPSTALTGARTLVIRDTRSNLAVAAGGVIIK